MEEGEHGGFVESVFGGFRDGGGVEGDAIDGDGCSEMRGVVWSVFDARVLWQPPFVPLAHLLQLRLVHFRFVWPSSVAAQRERERKCRDYLGVHGLVG